jgi:hypothetical protein
MTAIALFHAMRSGIITSASTSNEGPSLGSVKNSAPWTVLVAAATTNRKIVNEIVLANGRKIACNAINVFPDPGKRSVLIDPGQCWIGLEGKNYKGAILLCGQDIIDDYLVHDSGADGAIMSYPYIDTGYSWPRGPYLPF